MKACMRCGNEYAESEFNKCSANPDGLQRWCRACQKEVKDKWYLENHEHATDYKLAYNTSHREENKVYSKIYRMQHLEHCREYGKQRYWLIRDKKLRQNKEWYKKYYPIKREQIIERVRIYEGRNPEKVKQWRKKHKHKRREIASGLVSDFTLSQWQECKKLFNHSCAYCGNSGVKLEQDHVIPVTKDGAYTKTNIVPACRSCNGSKRNHYLEEWYPSQIFFTEERFQKNNPIHI